VLISSGVQAAPHTGSLSSGTFGSTHVRSGSLLIIGDDQPMRTALRERFLADGYTLREASNAAQARELLEASHGGVRAGFDLVLAGNVGPDADSLGLVRELKARAPDSLFIVLGTPDAAHAASDVLAAGAFCVVTQPLDLEQLSVLVARALQTKHLERELLASKSGARPQITRGFPELPPEGVDIEELIAHMVMQALARTRGNKTRAASLLGMTRDQIRYRIEKYASATKAGIVGVMQGATSNGGSARVT
jgi:DNA-binding NtrC family response regulator